MSSIEIHGWALLSRDRSPVAQFEHTVAVFRDYTEILTAEIFTQGALPSQSQEGRHGAE